MAKAAKVKRYEARNEQQRQNKVFEVDKGRLYQELDGKERHGTLIPDIAHYGKTQWNITLRLSG